MRKNGKQVKEIQVIEKLIRSLDSKFDFVAVAIEESKDLKERTIKEIMRSLITYEQRILKKEPWNKHFRPSFHIRRMQQEEVVSNEKDFFA